VLVAVLAATSACAQRLEVVNADLEIDRLAQLAGIDVSEWTSLSVGEPIRTPDGDRLVYLFGVGRPMRIGRNLCIRPSWSWGFLAPVSGSPGAALVESSGGIQAHRVRQSCGAVSGDNYVDIVGYLTLDEIEQALIIGDAVLAHPDIEMSNTYLCESLVEMGTMAGIAQDGERMVSLERLDGDSVVLRLVSTARRAVIEASISNFGGRCSVELGELSF